MLIIIFSCIAGVMEVQDIESESVTVEIVFSEGQEGEKQGERRVSQGEGGTLPRDNVETTAPVPTPPKDFGRAEYRSY